MDLFSLSNKIANYTSEDIDDIILLLSDLSNINGISTIHTENELLFALTLNNVSIPMLAFSFVDNFLKIYVNKRRINTSLFEANHFPFEAEQYIQTVQKLSVMSTDSIIYISLQNIIKSQHGLIQSLTECSDYMHYGVMP